MTEEVITPWQGDWQRRLQRAIEKMGFKTLDEFLIAHPADSYFSLAKLLNANIAPMQLYGEHLRTASHGHRIRAAAADCLVRFLVYYVKRGWGNGRHFQSRLASAYATWKTCILQFAQGDTNLAEKLDAVWNALEASRPPSGWIPAGECDPFIQQAFATGWPENLVLLR